MRKLFRGLKVYNTIIVATIIMLIISTFSMNLIAILGYLCILINVGKYQSFEKNEYLVKQNYLLFAIYILNVILNLTNVYNLIPWLVASILEYIFVRKINEKLEN